MFEHDDSLEKKQDIMEKQEDEFNSPISFSSDFNSDFQFNSKGIENMQFNPKEEDKKIFSDVLENIENEKNITEIKEKQYDDIIYHTIKEDAKKEEINKDNLLHDITADEPKPVKEPELNFNSQKPEPQIPEQPIQKSIPEPSQQQNSGYNEGYNTSKNNQYQPQHQTYTSTYIPGSQGYGAPQYTYNNQGQYRAKDLNVPYQQNFQPPYGYDGQNRNLPPQNQVQQQPPYQPPYQSPYKPGYQEQAEYKPEIDNQEEIDEPLKKPKKSNGGKVFAIIMVLLVLMGVGVATGIFLFKNAENIGMDNGASRSESAQENNNEQGLQINNTPDSTTTPKENGGFSPKEIFEKCSPSVVAITSTSNSIDPFGGVGSSSFGSGIIMSADGYIITNAHVISSSKNNLSVQLADGETYPAKFIAADAKYDIGLIKIEAKNLVAADFGDSSKLTVGDAVYAIGNPGGPELQSSFSQGIVSGLNRTVIIENYNDMKYIQTDAAINPGNSGGALINEFGQVIGINTAKVSETGFEGLGFAIPIKDAQPIIDELKNNGKISNRARLGVTLYEIDDSIADRYNMPKGLMVYEVLPESDFLKQGIQRSDIITEMEGKQTFTMEDISNIIKDKKPGDKVNITISRRERTMDSNNEFTNAYKKYEYTVELIPDNETF